MGENVNPGLNVNFYGALGDYEKSVRERKFRIAESEDKITNLKAALKDARLKNERLESKSETLKLESEMEAARYQSETHKKSRLESQMELLFTEYEEASVVIGQKKVMLKNIEGFRESRVTSLKKTEQDFMERYRNIPSIGTYMDLSEELKQLETYFQEKQLEVKKLGIDVEKVELESKNNWKGFVDLCITIAVTRDALRTKTTEYEDFYRRQAAVEASALKSTGNKENVETFDKSIGIISEPGPHEVQITNKTTMPDSTILESGFETVKSTSLENKLLQIRNGIHSHWPKAQSTPKPSATVGLGIKRYYNAVEELKSKGASSNYSSENDLRNSINEIHKKYSTRHSLPLTTNKSESRLGQQLSGYKATYSSWLTGMVESQNGDQQSKTKKSKPDDVTQENIETIKDSSGVPNNRSTSASDSHKIQPSVSDNSKTNVDTSDKPEKLSSSNQSVTVENESSNKAISKSALVMMKNDTSGLFKVPQPPPSRVNLISKPTPDSSPFVGGDLFMGDGTGNQFHMHSTSLDIFGNTPNTDSNTSDGNPTPSSSLTSSHALFDFENLFGPGKNSPLF